MQTESFLSDLLILKLGPAKRPFRLECFWTEANRRGAHRLPAVADDDSIRTFPGSERLTTEPDHTAPYFKGIRWAAVDRLGTFQEQRAGSLKAKHVKRGPLVKSQAKRKR
jgi:hypothetical protein